MAPSAPHSASPLPFEVAMERWLGAFYHLCAAAERGEEVLEDIPSAEARGRILARPAIARLSSPQIFSAALDGLALSSQRLLSASPTQPALFQLGRDCHLLARGAPLPAGCDVVLPLEEVRFQGVEVQVSAPSEPWRNVRPIGEDIEEGAVLAPRGMQLRWMDIGALLVGGVERVTVYRRPHLAVVNVGARSVPPGIPLRQGEEVDATGVTMQGLLRELGAEPSLFNLRLGPNLERIGRELAAIVAGHDLSLVIVEPNEGLAELKSLIATLGEVIAENIALRPGEEIILARVEGRPTLVAPYYPGAVWVACQSFLNPLVELMLGRSSPPPEVVEWARLAHSLEAPPPYRELVRVSLGLVQGQRVAVPRLGGSDLTMELVRCDGLVLLSPPVNKLPAGGEVLVKRLAPLRSIERHLIAMGTQDVCVKLLSKYCLLRPHPLSIIWYGQDSQSSFQSLRQGLCHLAALHIFDPQSGSYNIPYLENEARGLEILLVNLYKRQLGLVVAAGNPLKITSLKDLLRPEVRFVNRPLGSGTRSLLDWKLAQEGISPQEIRGFAHCVHNHLEVAAEVAAGKADVGLSLPAAARALGLDYLPCLPESLDLAIPRSSLEHPALSDFLAVLQSEEFRKESARSLPFYDFSRSGQKLWQNF